AGEHRNRVASASSQAQTRARKAKRDCQARRHLDRGGVSELRSRRRHDRGDRRGALALSRYCLDTSAYSNFKRGDPQVVDLFDRAEWLGVPSIALGELEMGFLLGGRLEKNRAELAEFLSWPRVEEIHIDQEISRIYAQMAISLRRAGTPIPTN